MQACWPRFLLAQRPRRLSGFPGRRPRYRHSLRVAEIVGSDRCGIRSFLYCGFLALVNRGSQRSRVANVLLMLVLKRLNCELQRTATYRTLAYPVSPNAAICNSFSPSKHFGEFTEEFFLIHNRRV